MGNYLFRTRSVASQEDEETGISLGDDIEIPILVHELYSRPHNVIAVPEIYEDEEIETAVENIEEQLGYELEKPDDWDEVRMDGEEMKEKAEFAKQAGFVNGEFHAK